MTATLAWGDPDGNGVHGLNERRSVRAAALSS